MGGWEWWRISSEGVFGGKESEPDPPVQKWAGFCAETTTKEVKQLLPPKTLDPRDSVLGVLGRGGRGGSQSQQRWFGEDFYVKNPEKASWPCVHRVLSTKASGPLRLLAPCQAGAQATGKRSWQKSQDRAGHTVPQGLQLCPSASPALPPALSQSTRRWTDPEDRHPHPCAPGTCRGRWAGFPGGTCGKEPACQHRVH